MNLPEDIPADLTSFALIDLDTISANVAALKSLTAPGVIFHAVVKANAYGHGLIQAAQAALAGGAERVAVNRVEEGAGLRRAGLAAPILVMGYGLPAQMPAAAEHDLIVTVNTPQMAQALSAAAQALGKTARLHLKIDTGMGRYGLLPPEALPFLRMVSRLPGLHVEGVYTHFAAADEADPAYTQMQLAALLRVRTELEAAGFNGLMWHAANSAGLLGHPAAHLGAVRAGVAIYGLWPSEETPRPIALRPALSIHSRVARVRSLPAGASVGYGCTFTAQRPTTAALIPVGYGDGYSRALSNRAAVLIGGQRAPQIGRVSMDQIVVDVTDIPGTAQDDPAVLLGAQGEGRISAEELAALSYSSNYEVTTRLLPRLARVYVRAGRVVDVITPVE